MNYAVAKERKLVATLKKLGVDPGDLKKAEALKYVERSKALKQLHRDLVLGAGKAKKAAKAKKDANDGMTPEEKAAKKEAAAKAKAEKAEKAEKAKAEKAAKAAAAKAKKASE